MPTALRRAATLAALVSIATATGAPAQEVETDPHHPDATATENTPTAESGEMGQQDQGLPPGQSGMMGEGMMAGTMQPGMMDGMPMLRMHGHMMKMAFAIADADGDGALSFEEISAIQRRIFDAVDADQSGTATPEELQGFMRE